MLRNIIRQAADSTRNFTVIRKSQLTYIAEPAKWATQQVGRYLLKQLNQGNKFRGKLSTTAAGTRGQIVHFGSLATFLKPNSWHQPHPSNKIIVTVFHLSPLSKQNHLLKQADEIVDYWHTTNQQTKQQLLALGLSTEKIVVIPLGVDSHTFRPPTPKQRQAIRQKMNIPAHTTVIGSFQKDGVGWGQGTEPKLIKGPDIFADAVADLAHRHQLHILIVGPARGYITQKLKEANISFTDIGYLHEHSAITKYYHALDIYLITSRLEGGPQQILEAWASGVPVVATRVGLIPDIANDKNNAMLCPSEDTRCLAAAAANIITTPELKQRLITNGRIAANQYAWSEIARRYRQELYARL